MTRQQAMQIAEGEYIATYDDPLGLNDPGSRCGYSDSALHEIRGWLQRRGLDLHADDIGLRVVPVTV